MTEQEYLIHYKNHNKYVLSMLWKTVYKLESIEDIAQEVWLKVWASRHTFDPSKSSFKTWLTVVVESTRDKFLSKYYENQPITYNDSTVSGNPGDSEAGEGTQESFIETMIPARETAEDDQLLHELIMRGATLSEQESAIFNLVYWHGWSHKAVADKFGISESTVRNAAMHLREKLETKELYHSAYTYHAPGAVWGDWSWKGQNSPWVSRPDLVAAYNGEVQ